MPHESQGNRPFRALPAEPDSAEQGAATAAGEYVRVIAGAGPGKTRAFAARFAYCVNESSVLPGHILCVAFTICSRREVNVDSLLQFNRAFPNVKTALLDESGNERTPRVKDAQARPATSPGPSSRSTRTRPPAGRKGENR